MAINSVSFQSKPFDSSKILVCDELQKKWGEIHQLTFIYVVQVLTNEAIPCSGLTMSMHNATNEQLVRSPALRPSNSVLKSM